MYIYDAGASWIPFWRIAASYQGQSKCAQRRHGYRVIQFWTLHAYPAKIRQKNAKKANREGGAPQLLNPQTDHVPSRNGLFRVFYER